MGNPTAAFRNVSTVEDWFKSLNHPAYTLYAGTQKKPGDVIVRMKDFDGVDSAWESLEKNLRDAGEDGGTFTVFVPKNSDNMGFTATVILPRMGGGHVAGIGSIGIGDVEKQIERRVEQQIELYELKREIADLRAAQEPTPTFIAGIERYIGAEATGALIQSLVGAAVGFLTSGTPPQNNVNGSMAMPDNEYRNVGANQQPQTDDNDPINQALDEFEQLGFDLETDLPALVKLAKQNPTMVKSLLGKPSNPINV